MILKRSFPFGLHVSWNSSDDVRIPNDTLNDWLLNTGSLTERLQAKASNFNVELLGQEMACSGTQSGVSLHQNEAEVLPDYQLRDWQIREVLLKDGDVPWVFARSVLPDALCRSKWEKLGNQPLGQRIFNDAQFVRSDFFISKLDFNPLGSSIKKPIWARRSVFSIDIYYLLVAEVFLPDAPCFKPD